jgi:hypothetical protein
MRFCSTIRSMGWRCMRRRPKALPLSYHSTDNALRTGRVWDNCSVHDHKMLDMYVNVYWHVYDIYILYTCKLYSIIVNVYNNTYKRTYDCMAFRFDWQLRSAAVLRICLFGAWFFSGHFIAGEFKRIAGLQTRTMMRFHGNWGTTAWHSFESTAGCSRGPDSWSAWGDLRLEMIGDSIGDCTL